MTSDVEQYTALLVGGGGLSCEVCVGSGWAVMVRLGGGVCVCVCGRVRLGHHSIESIQQANLQYFGYKLS